VVLHEQLVCFSDSGRLSSLAPLSFLTLLVQAFLSSRKFDRRELFVL
jgi:hypothetical protein